MVLGHSVDGRGFAEMVRAGHQKLQENVDAVNALNVFPVPDGDTGTNMELSLRAGVSRLAERDDWRLSDVAQALAIGLLMGARGNSGVILSQLFRGFVKVTQRVDELTPAVFAEALREGVEIAYRAVAKPVEGTILTVAREAAAAGMREAKQHPYLAEWMAAVVRAARVALEKTPQQLPVLYQAGVVDSGGQGLVFIYEGFLTWLRRPLDGDPAAAGADRSVERPALPPRLAAVSDGVAAVCVSDGPIRGFRPAVDTGMSKLSHGGDSGHCTDFGYCTEVLVRISDADTTASEHALRQEMAKHGDSLVVVGAEGLVKVHVHTLHPGLVLEDALRWGDLLLVKVDNMTEQHAANRRFARERKLPAADPQRAGSDAPRTGVVAIASGDGFARVFESLGVNRVVSGGQTMNPSTEQVWSAVQSLGSAEVILLPNHKNILPVAQQVAEMAPDRLHVVPTVTLPEGIAAAMAWRPDADGKENAQRMARAAARVVSGSVVRAVRDSVYQGRAIQEGQFLGFVKDNLVDVGDQRSSVAINVVRAMVGASAELLTVFTGAQADAQEARQLADIVRERFGLQVEVQHGGQPVYDYIFALE
ncbi:MAG: DAK2 domain-containing protein [Alicyclobacillaceae bacterium]|nr:DAK2 domain-containing protein [Alicyclobacillaceae bacterium]